MNFMNLPSDLSSQPNQAPQTWTWRGYSITYQSSGKEGPAVVFIHGFGASWGHWRKNIPVLAKDCRCYALDLIGFGGSAKPTPDQEVAYTFETWGEQVADFCQQVVGTPVFLVGNSIGCIVAMQTAVTHPRLALGVVAINFSLRLLHERKRADLPWHRRLSAPIMQKLLTQKWLGKLFFRQIAKPGVVRSILNQAYHHPEAVTEELIEMLLQPAADPGAAEVFLAFTRYSRGPLPEDLIPQLPCPLLILWGAEDPWEPIELARQFATLSTVDEFIPLAGLGHCPQDEAPDRVNPILQEWILSRAAGTT